MLTVLLFALPLVVNAASYAGRLVARQDLDDCTTGCITQAAISAACTDAFACLCSNTQFQSQTISCLKASCPANDTTSISTILTEGCAAYSSSIIGGSTAAPTTGDSSSTSSPVSGSSSGSSTSSPSADRTAAAHKSSIAPIVGGAGGGVLLLLGVGIAACLLCRRRRAPATPAAMPETAHDGFAKRPRMPPSLGSDASMRPLTFGTSYASGPSIAPSASTDALHPPHGYNNFAGAGMPPMPPMSAFAPEQLYQEPKQHEQQQSYQQYDPSYQQQQHDPSYQQQQYQPQQQYPQPPRGVAMSVQPHRGATMPAPIAPALAPQPAEPPVDEWPLDRKRPLNVLSAETDSGSGAGAGASSGQRLAPQQLDVVQTLVQRGVDPATVADVVQRMAAGQQPHPGAGGMDDAPPPMYS